ncbi:MAG: family 1 encapsulin nanocompartment shell protein, partial [bacterium]
MNLLKRTIAPVTDEAWKEIEDEASRVLKSQLSARTLVDLSGPHGWELGAINLGRVAIPKKQAQRGVHWGPREVLPLIEVRVPFKLNQLEIDNITRGSADADLNPVSDASRKIALFEDGAIYNGFAAGNIEGILPASKHRAVALPADPDAFPDAVGKAVKA